MSVPADQMAERIRRAPVLPPLAQQVAAVNAAPLTPAFNPQAVVTDPAARDLRARGWANGTIPQAPVQGPPPAGGPAPATRLPAGNLTGPFVQPAPASVALGAAPPIQPPPAAAPAAPAAAASPAARTAGRGGMALLGGAVEALNVAGAARTGGAQAAVDETVDGAGRLAAAQAGASLGARVPLPGVLRAVGPIAGGIAGYAGGASAVERMRGAGSQEFRQDVNDAQSLVQAGLPAPLGGTAQNPLDVTGRLVDSQKNGPSLAGAALALLPRIERQMAAPDRPARSTTSTPAASATPSSITGPQKGQKQVTPSTDPTTPDSSTRALGTFTGSDGVERTINAGEADELAGKLGRSDAQPTQTAAQRLAAPATRGVDRFVDGERRRFIEQIDKSIADLGPIDRRGRRDALATMLGIKGRAVDSAFGASAAQGIKDAELQASTAQQQLSADVQREGQQITAANQRRQNTQTITTADGSMYAIEGSTLTPITTPDGTQATAATRADTAYDALAARLLEASLPPGGMATPEELNAAVQQAQSASQALRSAGAAQKPSLEQFMAAAKSANPTWSDAELQAQYRTQYGK